MNVGYDVYRIKTEITEKGSKIDAGYYVDRRDKLTRDVRWELLDEDFVYTNKQMQWLRMIKDHITTSMTVEMDNFELAPFHEKGGAYKAYQLFGNDLNKILQEMNEVLAA